MSSWRKSPQELIDLFDAALPSDPRVERRKMFGYPAAFVNGNMCCGLHQDDLVIKLSPAEREMLVADYGAQRFEPMPGRPMRAYLVAPRSLLAEREKLAAWLLRSVGYVAALPAKAPRARKAPAAAPAPEQQPAAS